MTDITQPEALDLSDWLEAVGGGPSAKRCAALLREQHARIVELEAQLDSIRAGGVQALSAAPAEFLKGVIALCGNRGYSPTNIEAWDKNDKWIADLWRQAEAMLAAEQTFITPESGKPPAEQQAAPKAAPAQQEWRLVLPGGKYTDDWESARVGDYNRGWNDYRRAAITALKSVVWPARASGNWVAAGTWLRNNYQDYPNIASLCDAMLEAAPQQEAQEPVAYVHVPHYTVEGKVRPVVSFEKYQQDYADGIYSTRIPLYTAPQPAPAPLSDDTKRLNWLLWKLPGDALRYVVGELSDTSSGAEFRAAIDAALAAQGGKA